MVNRRSDTDLVYPTICNTAGIIKKKKKNVTTTNRQRLDESTLSWRWSS